MSREPRARDRGFAFGAANAGAVAVTVRVYRRLLREAAGVGHTTLRASGAEVARTLAPRWPDVVDEIEGIAAGARQDPLALLAINARTELLAGSGAAGECSVVGQLRGGAVTLAQTWDWHPDLAPARVLWTVVRPEGGWLTTATEAGILAKLGLNGDGVACGLNFLTCSADGGLGGVPIHVLLRLLLEQACSAASALELLLATPTSASSCVTVATAAPPALFAVELSPGGAAPVWADRDGRLVHTNHFLSPPPSGVDTQPALHPGTLPRRRRLVELLRAGVDPLDALASHAPAEEPICRHADAATAWPDRRSTLLAIAIDPGRPALRVSAGPPCSAPFEVVPLPA